MRGGVRAEKSCLVCYDVMWTEVVSRWVVDVAATGCAFGEESWSRNR